MFRVYYYFILVLLRCIPLYGCLFIHLLTDVVLLPLFDYTVNNVTMNMHMCSRVTTSLYLLGEYLRHFENTAKMLSLRVCGAPILSPSACPTFTPFPREFNSKACVSVICLPQQPNVTLFQAETSPLH